MSPPLLEGWPFAGHPKRGRDLQSRYNQSEEVLAKAESRMRRAFAAWLKARKAHLRVIKQLERGA